MIPRRSRSAIGAAVALTLLGSACTSTRATTAPTTTSAWDSATPVGAGPLCQGALTWSGLAALVPTDVSQARQLDDLTMGYGECAVLLPAGWKVVVLSRKEVSYSFDVGTTSTDMTRVITSMGPANVDSQGRAAYRHSPCVTLPAPTGSTKPAQTEFMNIQISELMDTDPTVLLGVLDATTAALRTAARCTLPPLLPGQTPGLPTAASSPAPASSAG